MSTPFRLFSARVDESNAYAEKITFIASQQKGTNPDTFFSVIIGNNGTGKSRVLCSIAKLFREICEKKYNSRLFGSMADFTTIPNKVIALTNSLSDRFPLDKSYSRYISVYETYNDRQNYIKNLYRDSKYIYLGPKSKNYFFSNKTSMNRALDILFEYYSEREISSYYRYVFDYLDFEPILKLRYRVQNIFNGKELITKDQLFNLIIYRYHLSNSRTLNKESERAQRILEIHGDELCKFLNNREFDYEGSREILINFSQKNIDRFEHDNSQYLGNNYEYYILNILRKLNIVKSYDVRVYKKNGIEFNFSEASSGESNILSTLLALIPLLENNCLVLIDEPEISLHPIWQARYIELLNAIFSNYYGCHIIIASHSHFLVTDLPPERSTVITLHNSKKGIVSEVIEEPTFGWSAEDVLLNVFGLPTARNYYLSQILSKGLELLADHKRDNTEYKKVQKLISDYYPLMKDSDPLKSVASIILKKRFDE